MKKFTLGILLAFAALTLTAGLTACDGAHLHSYGDWETVEGREATCTESGLQMRRCTLPGCDEVEERTVPALGHDWSEGEVTKAPTCTEEGTQAMTCTRCHTAENFTVPAKGHDWNAGEVLREATCITEGKTHNVCLVCGTETDLTLPMLGHDWERTSVTPATCEEDGAELYTCSVCFATEKKELPALGHLWENGDVLKEATCVDAGLRLLVCARCDEEDEREIPAAGHKPEGDFTIDVRPTFESGGEKSHHCTVCGERLDVTPIPMLDENVPIEYEFRLLRNSGERLAVSSVTVTVLDGGVEVAKSTASQLTGGSYRVNLPPKHYTVTVSGLPEGYTAAEEYAAEPYDPLCKIYLTATPIAAPATETTRYQTGSVMHDFTIPAESNTTGQEITLSALLRAKRAVILNFWYVNCPNCVAEFQGLENVYRRYKDRAEVVAVDPYDSMAAIRNFGETNGLTFPMARDEAGLSKYFGVTGYPTTVVIDGEGVVSEIIVGATEEARFASVFEKYTADGYFVNAAHAALVRTEYLPAAFDRRRAQ